MDEDDDKQVGLACEGKLVFDNQAAAEGSAAAILWQRGTKLKVYNCRDCQLWHLATDYET